MPNLVLLPKKVKGQSEDSLSHSLRLNCWDLINGTLQLPKKVLLRLIIILLRHAPTYAKLSTYGHLAAKLAVRLKSHFCCNIKNEAPKVILALL